jgi:hypothetical protein
MFGVVSEVAFQEAVLIAKLGGHPQNLARQHTADRPATPLATHETKRTYEAAHILLSIGNQEDGRRRKHIYEFPGRS